MELMEDTDSVEEMTDYITNIQPTWKDGTENHIFTNQLVSTISYTDIEEHGNVSRKQNNNTQLCELEQQVEDAEVKCDTLMQQLEYMRMLYQDKFDQSQTEPEKASDNEETLRSPRVETLSTKMDSLELIHTIENVFHKDVSDTEVSLSLASDFMYPAATRNDDFEKEFNNKYKQCISPETVTDTKSDYDVKNEGCHFAEVNMESLNIYSQESVFNAVSATNISLLPNLPDSLSHSLMTKAPDNFDDTITDLSEKSSLGNTNVSDVVDTANDVINKKVVINPIKAIKGILNGITDSVSIISQLSVHASESGKKENIKKHHVHKHSTSSRLSKKPVLQNIQSSHILHDLTEEQTLEVINEENMKNSMIKETAYSESKFSIQHKNHRHHHHHHSGSQCHHNHHSSSMSCKGRINTPDHVPIETNPVHSMEDIFESFHSKQRNRSKEHKPKRESRNHSKQTIDVHPLKSSSDGRTYNVKEKSKKKSIMIADEQISFNKGKTSQSHNKGSKRLKSNTEDICSDVTREKKKRRKGKKVRPPTTVEDIAEDIQSASGNSNITAINVYKNESLKPQLSIENIKKPREVISLHSTSKNTQKSLNVVKTDGNKQITYIKIEKHHDQTPTTDAPVTKHTNCPYSVSHSTQEPSPNFAMPTLSSKLKQVEKPILQLFNFRNIPFVVGTSTTRSHNLALNLQQALSIIKMRNPSLSIGGDLNTEAASSVMGHQTRPSTAGSFVGHKSFCPVAVAQMKKFQSLDENKGSDFSGHDEKNEKMLIADNDSSLGTFSSLLKSYTETENIGGLSFPHMIKKENVWDVEQLDNTNKNFQMKLRCTCFPTRACIDYQKLLYEYLSNGKETQLLHMLLPSTDKREINSSQIPSRSRSGISELLQQQSKFNFVKEDIEFGDEAVTNPVYGQIQAHSKELKEVLMNMHRDFMHINEKYEHLQSEVQSSGVDGMEAIKELEKLESELQAKEDDIVIVMGLYKELTSLKQQVKALRVKTSSQNIMTKPITSQNILPREPTVSIRLTRLLRTIQKFQEKLLHE